MARYLLPCVCGRQIPVTTPQAGEQVQCECGQRVEVPTLRHLRALEQVADASPRRERSWGARQGVVFLGAAIIAIAAVCLLVLQLEKPPAITEPLVISNVESLSPGQLWAVWDQLEHYGIKRPLAFSEAALLRQHQIDMDTWNWWRMTTIAMGGVGVLIVNIGLFLIPGTRRKRTVL